MRRPDLSDPTRPSGFSLLEALVALIIVAILASIAYPSYEQTIMASRRAQGRAALMQTLLLQEHYYTQYNHYLTFNADTPNAAFQWWSGDTPGTSYYELQATTCPDQTLLECVLLIATPGTNKVHGHTDPICGSLQLDSHGHHSQSLEPDPNPPCW